ncbi:MAG: restriction endonuclease subunit S [Sarcina sp.]
MVKKDELKFNVVKLSEVIEQNTRFEATVFDLKGKKAREIIRKSGNEIVTICGEKGLSTAYHRPRFKRVWVEKSPYPIYQPGQILDIKPEPSGYISEITETDIDALRVRKGQILLTCSGTIGNTTLVTEELNNKIFSHDLIRITCKNYEDIGYLYTYLNTEVGRTILETNNYGAVISHIEPEHLEKVEIPNADLAIKQEINSLIQESFCLRENSNKLIDEAIKELKKALKLAEINNLNKKFFVENKNVENYSVKLSETSMRFDVSFCKPIYKEMNSQIKKNAYKIHLLGDERLTESIILAGVFKRVYVEKQRGYPFLGGREITQLNPKVDKYLSRIHHNSRYEKELKISENTILITDRGTIGKVAITPKHLENYAVSQNVIKVNCINEFMAGYIYAFLASDYGVSLIKKETYGSVVDMIDSNNLKKIRIPILEDEITMESISSKVLKANRERYEAFEKEKEAIGIMNRRILKVE